MPVGGPPDHLDPRHRAEEAEHVGWPLRCVHSHTQAAGAAPGIVAPAVSEEPSGPEAHVGVVGRAHQRGAGRQAQRAVTVADDRAHLHPVAVATDGLLAGPQPLDVAGAEAAQRPVPDLSSLQRASRLLAEELELGEMMLGAAQAVPGRMAAGGGHPRGRGAPRGPSNGTVVGLCPPTPTAAISSRDSLTRASRRPRPSSQAAGSARPGGQDRAPSNGSYIQSLTSPSGASATARAPPVPRSTPTTTGLTTRLPRFGMGAQPTITR